MEPGGSGANKDQIARYEQAFDYFIQRKFGRCLRLLAGLVAEGGAHLLAQLPHTPKPGSPERQAIYDAMRDFRNFQTPWNSRICGAKQWKCIARKGEEK